MQNEEAERERLIRDSQRWSDEIAREHRITVVEQDAMPKGVGAFACWGTRTVTVKPFGAALGTDVVLVRLAERAHEFGHILAGPCPGKGAHYSQRMKRKDGFVTSSCVACETLAWRAGIQLLPTWSRGMHERMKWSLLEYRLTTITKPEATAAARRIASDTGFAAAMERLAERERRRDMLREIEEIAEDARRPRLLTELERKIADIDRWAREVGR